jgi:hypothetical protein
MDEVKMILNALIVVIMLLGQSPAVTRCVVDPCEPTRLICIGWQREGDGTLNIWQAFAAPITAPFPGDPAACSANYHTAIFEDPYSNRRVIMWWWYVDGQPMVMFQEIVPPSNGGILDI